MSDMQEEIKEILDKLQKVANRETASRNALMEMKDKDYQLLLDYITNLQEEKKLHANDIEFNINNDKKDCIITLDENDLGIDKLHLDNCYFYKENDKWYVKHINLKPIAYISQEHKIPEKFKVHSLGDKDKYGNYVDSPFPTNKELMNKINEILDYLEEIE